MRGSQAQSPLLRIRSPLGWELADAGREVARLPVARSPTPPSAWKLHARGSDMLPPSWTRASRPLRRVCAQTVSSGQFRGTCRVASRRNSLGRPSPH